MIQYALKCDEGHAFDSWFQSAAAFDRLQGSGLVACAVCGSDKVDKAIMTPRVSASARRERPLSALRTDRETALRKLRDEVLSKADYVGPDFAREARAIHTGERPERAIYGEARLDEARALIEDGVPVAPLPMIPPRKAN